MAHRADTVLVSGVNTADMNRYVVVSPNGSTETGERSKLAYIVPALASVVTGLVAAGYIWNFWGVRDKFFKRKTESTSDPAVSGAQQKTMQSSSTGSAQQARDGSGAKAQPPSVAKVTQAIQNNCSTTPQPVRDTSSAKPAQAQARDNNDDSAAQESDSPPRSGAGKPQGNNPQQLERKAAQEELSPSSPHQPGYASYADAAKVADAVLSGEAPLAAVPTKTPDMISLSTL